MLDELGTAIGSHLGEVLPVGTEVLLDPPSQAWKDRRTGLVSLFLHQVLENSDGAAAGLWTEERDLGGRVVSRTSPEKRYDFCYLVTAWSTSLEVELGMLGNILRSIAHSPVVPAARLTGSVAQVRGPVTLSVGHCGSPSFRPEFWPALGLPPRVCLDLLATAPVPAVIQTELSRPPETIDLGVAGPAAATRPGPGPRADGGPRRRPTARISEGVRDGQARGQAG